MNISDVCVCEKACNGGKERKSDAALKVKSAQPPFGCVDLLTF